MGLILHGKKTIEVRSWATKHRGRLWLHAGKKIDHTHLNLEDLGLSATDITLGAIVGHCELADCTVFDLESWERQRGEHWNLGSFVAPKYGWHLKDIVRLEKPVPMQGSLGLMTLGEETLGALADDLR